MVWWASFNVWWDFGSTSFLPNSAISFSCSAVAGNRSLSSLITLSLDRIFSSANRKADSFSLSFCNDKSLKKILFFLLKLHLNFSQTGGGGLVTKSCPILATPWTVAYRAPLSMRFSRQEYWSGLRSPAPGDLPNAGIEPGSPALQADSLPTELQGKHTNSQMLLSVQFSLSVMSDSATQWTAAYQASLSNCQNLLKLMSIELVMLSNHPILCHPLLLLPSIFPSIRVFSNESALSIRWPKCWSFSFNISPSKEHPGLISFRMDWLDLLAVQGTLKSLNKVKLYFYVTAVIYMHIYKIIIYVRSFIVMMKMKFSYNTVFRSYSFRNRNVGGDRSIKKM